MKQERVILSFIMVLIGLIVAGATFYFYQSNKKTPPNNLVKTSPTPTQSANNDKIKLTLISPIPESVVNNKNLTVSGNTNPNATVIIITKSDQQVSKADEKGKFNASVTLNNDQNLVTVISILPTGENKTIQVTVTYSTSNF